jgi:hypothetical protein
MLTPLLVVYLRQGNLAEETLAFGKELTPITLIFEDAVNDPMVAEELNKLSTSQEYIVEKLILLKQREEPGSVLERYPPSKIHRFSEETVEMNSAEVLSVLGQSRSQFVLYVLANQSLPLLPFLRESR